MKFSVGLIGFLLAMTSMVYAQQTGRLLGSVKDRNTQEALVGVTIVLDNTAALGTITDIDGNFALENVPTGSYNVKASFLGYKPLVKYNIVVTSGNDNNINFELEEEATQLDAVEIAIDRSVSVGTRETPISIQRLSTEEIKSNPGGNFDISRVVQALPGVGGTAGSVGGYRNDIIIRGGAPNENVYYLDGIEVPVINHFATQGSAGGPTGILNVSFIEDVTLSASSFDARYDNALSSVLQFKQREGNRKLQGNLRMSATDVALTMEGPISKQTTFMASARRSYLQFLFKAIDLPIRPNYWDFQYKVTSKINAKTTLSFLGLGAIDEFKTAVPKESSLEKEYILRSVPINNQWNYTVGMGIKRLINNGFLNIALSRNMFDNKLDRFEDAQYNNEEYRTLKSRSQEIENKLRIDVNKYQANWKYSFGISGQYVKYNNQFYNRLQKEVQDDAGNIVQPEIAYAFNTAIGFARLGAFGQVSRRFFNEKLSVSAGVRTDLNTFTDQGMNPLKTLSPRLALSYSLNEQWKLNATVGKYYKIPIYTVLGYRDANGSLVNKSNSYIGVAHYVAGLEWLPTKNMRITAEGFFKQYSNYPVSVLSHISLANQGGDFGAIGNEAVQSIGKGKTYGGELFLQRTLSKRLFAVASYTLFWSQFTTHRSDNLPVVTEKYVASAWDTRHLLSLIGGYKFNRGWEVGLKYRWQGGAPYTPFDMVASQLNYITLGSGVLDYANLNTERLKAFNSLDIRIDKKWNFKSVTLDLFVDITNLTGAKTPSYPSYTFERNADNSGFATTDGLPLAADGSNAIPVVLNDDDALILPTIGFIIEF